MTKHVHCDSIKAWADGAQIQSRSPRATDWQDVGVPRWYEDYEYRIKPSPPVTKYRWAFHRLAADQASVTAGWYSKEEIKVWSEQTCAKVLGKIAETKKIF